MNEPSKSIVVAADSEMVPLLVTSLVTRSVVQDVEDIVPLLISTTERVAVPEPIVMVPLFVRVLLERLREGESPSGIV